MDRRTRPSISQQERERQEGNGEAVDVVPEGEEVEDGPDDARGRVEVQHLAEEEVHAIAGAPDEGRIGQRVRDEHR